MLRSLKLLYGEELGASDGEIGRVKDFYFDERNWAVRYVVADTGAWLPGRKVLLSPHAFGRLHQAGRVLSVNLTRKQIQDCPSIESRKPVSRQYEEEFYQYYGWPRYWQGGGLWGVDGLPLRELPVKSQPNKPVGAGPTETAPADGHLRSTQAVGGYHLKASDAMAGHVCDFMMDAQSWAITHLVIKTGHRLSGQEVLIPAGSVNRTSYEESTVFVKMTREAVTQSPHHNPSPIGTAN